MTSFTADVMRTATEDVPQIASLEAEHRRSAVYRPALRRFPYCIMSHLATVRTRGIIFGCFPFEKTFQVGSQGRSCICVWLVPPCRYRHLECTVKAAHRLSISLNDHVGSCGSIVHDIAQPLLLRSSVFPWYRCISGLALPLHRVAVQAPLTW